MDKLLDTFKTSWENINSFVKKNSNGFKYIHCNMYKPFELIIIRIVIKFWIENATHFLNITAWAEFYASDKC